MSLILDGTNGLSDVDGTAATPAIRGTDTNTGIFFPAADTIAFSEGGAERMRIASGDVTIGTTTSYGKTTSASNVGAGYIYASVSISNQANHMVFKNDATTVGSISRNGGSAVSYNTSSDYRLKENIAPMTGALTAVQQLKPCTYTWKVDGSFGQGFIAHELFEVCPDAVDGEKDAVETYTDEDGNEQTRIKPQGIDTSFLVATLTAAIQELNAKVDAQAARIAALEGTAV